MEKLSGKWCEQKQFIISLIPMSTQQKQKKTLTWLFKPSQNMSLSKCFPTSSNSFVKKGSTRQRYPMHNGEMFNYSTQ